MTDQFTVEEQAELDAIATLPQLTSRPIWRDVEEDLSINLGMLLEKALTW